MKKNKTNTRSKKPKHVLFTARLDKRLHDDLRHEAINQSITLERIIRNCITGYLETRGFGPYIEVDKTFYPDKG